MIRPFLWMPALVVAMLVTEAGLSAQRRQIKVFVSVVDRAKAPVLDLRPADFEVSVGGVKGNVVRVSLASEPMRIALLVDTSEEAKLPLNHIRSGLQAFLDAIPAPHEIALVSMGGQARVRVAPTSDHQKVKNAIDSLFPDGGGTVLLDALRETYDRFLRRVEDRWPVFVILTTDGPDRSGISDLAFETFIRDIQGAAATAHAIVLTSSAQSFQNSRTWTASLVVTDYTGGQIGSVAASSALPVRMKALADQIAAQQREVSTKYEVDFITESRDPEAIIVVHVARDDVVVGLSAGRRMK